MTTNLGRVRGGSASSEVQVRSRESRRSAAIFRFFGSLGGERLFPSQLSDETDQPFVDVAFTGRADVLITGNVKDFPVGEAIRVVTPREWVNMRETLRASK
jgi:hypothetical protein